MNKTLWLTYGIPASGKSTWRIAKFPDAPYINLDTIRIDNPTMRPADHWELAYSTLSKLCSTGEPVIVCDNTHIHRQALQQFAAIAAGHGYTINVMYFDVTLETALARNELRAGTKAYVPPSVIASFYRDRASVADLHRIPVVDVLYTIDENGNERLV